MYTCENKQIIGQIEAHPLKKNPTVGYVNFYFLVPEFRGTGLGRLLARRLHDRGVQKRRLYNNAAQVNAFESART